MRTDSKGTRVDFSCHKPRVPLQNPLALKWQNGLQGFDNLSSSPYHSLVEILGTFLLLYYYIFINGFRSTGLILNHLASSTHLFLLSFDLKHFSQRFWIQHCFLSSKSRQRRGGVFWHQYPPGRHDQP